MKRKSRRLEGLKAILYAAIIVLISFQFTTIVVKHTVFPLDYIAGKDLENHLELEPGWVVEEIGWFTAKKIDGEWWEIYVRINKANEPYIWTNDFVYYNIKTKEVRANFRYE